jgi:hypothetical protein
MRSTEETLNMERKLIEAKKTIKKIKKENETLETPNKILKVESDKLLSNKKHFKVSNSLQSVKSQNAQKDISSISTSPESSTSFSVSDNSQHPPKPGVLQVSSQTKVEPIKPFPPYSTTQDLEPFNPFPLFGNVVLGQLFSPFSNIHTGKPLPPSQDGNNNPKDVTKESEAPDETEFENSRNSIKMPSRKVSSSLETTKLQL